MAIGRSVDNDWVLPDPERLVSSRHCIIQQKNGRYYLTDNSTNGVQLVNADIHMRRGTSEPLKDREVIRIGDYEIRVRIDFKISPSNSGFSEDDSSNSFEALTGRQESMASAVPDGQSAAHFQAVRRRIRS